MFSRNFSDFNNSSLINKIFTIAKNNCFINFVRLHRSFTSVFFEGASFRREVRECRTPAKFGVPSLITFSLFVLCDFSFILCRSVSRCISCVSGEVESLCKLVYSGRLYVTISNHCSVHHF